MGDRVSWAGPVDAVVVAAMPEELRPLRRMLSDPQPIAGAARQAGQAGQAGQERMVRGWLAGRRVLLATTGDGARKAAAGTAQALSATEARILIAIGLAGALTGELRSGDVVAVARVVGERPGGALAAAPAVLGLAPPGIHAAVAVSTARIADTAAEKRRLRSLAHPEPGLAAVVDLESIAFARSAAAARLPWLILRAISDTADEALPPVLNGALDTGGAVVRGRVLAGLLARPSALPALFQLRRRMGTCAEALAAIVRTTLRRLDGRPLVAGHR